MSDQGKLIYLETKASANDITGLAIVGNAYYQTIVPTQYTEYIYISNHIHVTKITSSNLNSIAFDLSAQWPFQAFIPPLL